MLFFQGSWFCTQCGYEYNTYINECKFCEGEDFSDQPIVERSDYDQLSNDEQIQLEMELGMEVF